MVGNNIIESGLKVSKMYIDFILIDRLSCLMRISLFIRITVAALLWM